MHRLFEPMKRREALDHVDREREGEAADQTPVSKMTCLEEEALTLNKVIREKCL